jgi:hypothetical protein
MTHNEIETIRQSIQMEPAISRAKAEVYDWIIGRIKGGVTMQELLDECEGRRGHIEQVMVGIAGGKSQIPSEA